MAFAVAPTAFLAAFLQPLSPLLTPALLALQQVAVAIVLALLDDAAARGVPRSRTTVAGFLAVANAAAAGACGGVAAMAALMFTLVGWTSERFDLVRGLMLLGGVGIVGVALAALVIVGSIRRYAVRMRLQPGERFFVFLGGIVAMGIAFLVLLQR